MEKDTKTFKCDGCKKTVVLDFYDPTAKEAIEKEMLGWITIRLRAMRRNTAPSVSPDFIPDTTGHACSEKCVEEAIGNIILRKMPEQPKR